ncbi:MAG: 30S ribosome-binding factor RbfA [Bacteroidales bacterium]|nr:MAG: 30S ribosome-binding factor RbfA [Bacteroidales bacterium]
MESTRQKKVARSIQKELGSFFQRQGSGIFPGKMITVTVVRISPDLSQAKVYLSIFPSGNSREILKSISEKGKTIRHELGNNLRNQLRIIPELSFFLDDSLDYVQNIEDLLKS